MGYLLIIVIYVIVALNKEKPKSDIDKIFKNLDDLHGPKNKKK